MIYDIVFAALLALVITWMIGAGSRIMRVVITRSTELGYRPSDLDLVLQRCYGMFPIESLSFKGATFRRGMFVRVLTNRNKTIEGRFVGTNKDNMVCFLTPNSVIAHELDNIEEMRLVGEREW